jgi:hypothetical protein
MEVSQDKLRHLLQSNRLQGDIPVGSDLGTESLSLARRELGHTVVVTVVHVIILQTVGEIVRRSD